MIGIFSLRFPTHYVTIGERNTRITGPPTFKQQCSYTYYSCSLFAFPVDPHMITNKKPLDIKSVVQVTALGINEIWSDGV